MIHQDQLKQEYPVLFYDGDCGLCQHSVKWTLRRDLKRRLRYAPLQGIYAKDNLPEKVRQDLSAVILKKDAHIYVGFDAVSMLLDLLEHPFRYILKPIPRFLGRFLYSVVAKYRHLFFSKNSECLLLNEEERNLFIP